MRFEDPTSATPEEYELAVKEILDAAGASLVKYDSSHLEKLQGTDGDYIIDVVARFSSLGADFVVLVECKHHKRKVERQDIQILHSKMQSVGAQKAMLFSVSGFQEGAIEYAKVHGIALIQFASGATSWFTKGAGPPSPPPPWANVQKYIGWWHSGAHVMLLSAEHGEYTRQALGLQQNEP
jgi:restriction system protein